jgi:hypothetical protein
MLMYNVVQVRYHKHKQFEEVEKCFGACMMEAA